jgi:hypothetical protein
MKMIIVGWALLFLMTLTFFIGLNVGENKKQENAPEPVMSTCDSVQLVNNSMKYEIELLQDKISKYEVGLGFLKDKNKKAYQYVINAGNLKFNDCL